MFDHVSLAVSDIAKAKLFYEAALKPLGIAVLWEVAAERQGEHPTYGFGDVGTAKPYFWLAQSQPLTGRAHVAFVAADRAAVDAFHQAALAAGGRDNGPPGPRPNYHPNYYGAFVLDPDGLNIEAVCHTA